MSATATRTRKPPQPVHGRCRWVSVSRFTFAAGASALLEINGTTYSVKAHTDNGRITGYRLTKPGGTEYDVNAETRECTCPDCVYRGRPCKHAKGLFAALAVLETPRGAAA